MANLKDRCRLKFEKEVRKEVTSMFESILDYTQIACADPNTFKALRSKILRAGNDCIRSVIVDLNDYEIKYIAKNEDIIEIKQ